MLNQVEQMQKNDKKLNTNIKNGMQQDLPIGAYTIEKI